MIDILKELKGEKRMLSFQGREINGTLRCRTFDDLARPCGYFVNEWIRSRASKIDILSISTSWDGNNRYITTVWYVEEK